MAQNVQNQEEAVKKFHGAGVLSSIEDSAAEWFLSKRIPDLAKQGTESVRYYASELSKIAKENGNWLRFEKSKSYHELDRKQSINYQLKWGPIVITKLMEWILM